MSISQPRHTDHTCTHNIVQQRESIHCGATTRLYATCTVSPHAVGQNLDPGLVQSVPLFMEESPEMCKCVAWCYMRPYCPPQLIPHMLNGIQIWHVGPSGSGVPKKCFRYFRPPFSEAVRSLRVKIYIHLYTRGQQITNKRPYNPQSQKH